LNKRAFSMIEVVLSIGILSVALLIVFAVLTPFLSQTGEVVEATTVNRVTDRILAEIEQLTFTQLASILDQQTSLYASRKGDRLVLANDSQGDSLLPENDRFYAVALNRNEDLSPIAKDGTAGYLAYQVTIERIVRAPDGTLINSPLDHTLAIFNSATTRNDQ
jgi:prepilin-type N-terminal cleavage/methylation domain-containing protein